MRGLQLRSSLSRAAAANPPDHGSRPRSAPRPLPAFKMTCAGWPGDKVVSRLAGVPSGKTSASALLRTALASSSGCNTPIISAPYAGGYCQAVTTSIEAPSSSEYLQASLSACIEWSDP